MKNKILTLDAGFVIVALISCSNKIIRLTSDNLDVRNRDIVSVNSRTKSLILNDRQGDGMALIKGLEFEKGIIELELKGENNPGSSFVGIAFNIQNDSTYEAVYFRPFNFRSDEKTRREHSVQYIYHPKFTWRFLRTNHTMQFEAEYPRQPSPEDWFGVQVIIDDKTFTVYDRQTNTKLLSVDRLAQQVSDRLGLWTGFNSKGEFRNLKIKN